MKKQIEWILAKNVARNHKKKYLEHLTIGRRFVCPIVQATQRNIMQIDGFLMSLMDVSIAYFCYDWCKMRYFVVLDLDFLNRFFCFMQHFWITYLFIDFFIKKNNGNHDKDSISLRGDVCIYRLVCVCTFVLFSQTQFVSI